MWGQNSYKAISYSPNHAILLVTIGSPACWDKFADAGCLHYPEVRGICLGINASNSLPEPKTATCVSPVNIHSVKPRYNHVHENTSVRLSATSHMLRHISSHLLPKLALFIWAQDGFIVVSSMAPADKFLWATVLWGSCTFSQASTVILTYFKIGWCIEIINPNHWNKMPANYFVIVHFFTLRKSWDCCFSCWGNWG